MPTTTTPTVRIGAIVAANDLTNQGQVVADPCEGYPCPAGMFLINTRTPQDPWYTFGMLTGRTRQRWNMATPTIVRFAVDTVANDEGVILGVPGDRLPGTWFTRPENISE